jgi:D-sedoheptulose 7-phosphate isomerase
VQVDRRSSLGQSGIEIDTRGTVGDVARSYVEQFAALLQALDLEALARVTELIRVARDRGSMIFIAGNGGSAATATHWVNDMCKAASRSGRRPIRGISLSDNISWVTALGNDEGYDQVFRGQLVNLANRGDLLIVISASGNSPNLVEAVEYAQAQGLGTIGFLGFDGGRLRSMVDESIWVETPIGAYGPVESAHSVISDIITTFLIDDSE